MAIAVSNLTKRFGDCLAVDDVSFLVEQGELVTLLGPSGSGKSTILRIIAGLEEPDAGTIYLYGNDVSSSPPQKRNVGFVFQNYALFKHLTVQKNIAFGLEVQKRPKHKIQERVKELLHLVKLEGYEDRYPSQLSGGQRQRVALARSLAPEPKVLLLDEPFGALDAKVRQNLATWLRDLHRQIHITSVFVTHDQDEAIEISDEIVVLNRGKVEQIGKPEEIYDRPRTRFVASFVGTANVIEATVRDGKVVIGNDGMQLPIRVGFPDHGEVVVLVRPEDIAISRDVSHGDLTGTITGVRYRGDVYEATLETFGLSIHMIQPKEGFLEQNWQLGETVAILFDRFKSFQAEEGHEAIRERLRSLGYIE